MKKIKSVLLVIGLSISSLSFSQSLNEGPESPVVKGVGYQKLIGSDNTGFYVLKQSSIGKGLHILIEKFNNDNFKQIFSKETKVAEIQESMNFPAVTQIQTFLSPEKVFVFFESHNPKTDRINFFLQTVSTKGDLSEVYEISSSYFKAKNAALELMGSTYFKMCFSPDGKYFATVDLLETDKPVKNAPKSDKWLCKIYDATTFKKVADRSIPLTDQGTDIYCENFTIDNNQNLFFSVKYASGKKNSIGGFAIGLIESTSPTAKLFPITLSETKIFHDFAFKSLNNGDLLITGLVSDTLAKDVKSGVLQASYFVKRVSGNSLETKYEKMNDFLVETKMQLGEAVRATTFKNTEIIEMNDEVYITTQRTEIKYSPSKSDVISFMNAQTTNKEIIVTKIDSDGNLLWTKLIPKFHVGGLLISFAPKPPRYSGNYKMFVVGNKLNFVFLDSPENQDLTPENYTPDKCKPIHANAWGSESVVAKDKSVAVCVSIDNTGKSSKKIFLENVEDGVNYIALGRTVMVSPKKLLLFLENRKSKIERFATLNF